MSLGLNNWNNNQQVRDRMENESLEYQMRETNPDQAKRIWSAGCRFGVRSSFFWWSSWPWCCC